MDEDETLYMEIDGEMQEVVPFIWHDVGHPHVEMIGVMTKDTWNNVICEEKGIWEDIADLSVIFYTENEALGKE